MVLVTLPGPEYKPIEANWEVAEETEIESPILRAGKTSAQTI